MNDIGSRLSLLEFEIKSLKKKVNRLSKQQKDETPSDSAKKPRTAFQEYMSKTLPQIREELPDKNQKERFSIAAGRWKQYKNNGPK
jgi:hypothetical protein